MRAVIKLIFTIAPTTTTTTTKSTTAAATTTHCMETAEINANFCQKYFAQVSLSIWGTGTGSLIAHA